MDNHSMTSGDQFYLKAYCTASGPEPFRNPGLPDVAATAAGQSPGRLFGGHHRAEQAGTLFPLIDRLHGRNHAAETQELTRISPQLSRFPI